jgi:hypothetical protein
VELLTVFIRLDCECGYRRVANAEFTGSRWVPMGKARRMMRFEPDNVSGHALGDPGEVERVWLACPSPRCRRRYSYRSDTWNARMNQAAQLGRSVLVLGVDL